MEVSTSPAVSTTTPKEVPTSPTDMSTDVSEDCADSTDRVDSTDLRTSRGRNQLKRYIKSRVWCHTEEKIRGPNDIIIQHVRSVNGNDSIPSGGTIGVRCPECIVLDMSSEVNIGWCYKTSAGVLGFYKDGIAHCHDGNISRAKWSCSQGHAGNYKMIDRCPARQCSHTGYTILTSDPYEFAKARKARQQLDEEKNTMTNRNIVTDISSYPKTDTCSGETDDIPNKVYFAEVHTAQTVPAVTTTLPEVTTTLPEVTTTLPEDVPTAPAVQTTPAATTPLPTEPDVITVQITYGSRTYVGNLTALPVVSETDKK